MTEIYLGPGHLRVLRSLSPFTMEMEQIENWHRATTGGKMSQSEIQAKLHRLIAAGLVQVDGEGWVLTDRGIIYAARGWIGVIYVVAE